MFASMKILNWRLEPRIPTIQNAWRSSAPKISQSQFIHATTRKIRNVPTAIITRNPFRSVATGSVSRSFSLLELNLATGLIVLMLY